MKCHKCDGCGQIANSDDEEPWTVWTALPLNASAALLTGIVRPLPCPRCNGSGQVSDARWRTGSKVGRTLYFDEKLIGLVDEQIMASWIVRQLNKHQWPKEILTEEIIEVDEEGVVHPRSDVVRDPHGRY